MDCLVAKYFKMFEPVIVPFICTERRFGFGEGGGDGFEEVFAVDFGWC